MCISEYFLPIPQAGRVSSHLLLLAPSAGGYHKKREGTYMIVVFVSFIDPDL